MIKIADLNTKIQGKLHGRTLNKVADVYGKYGEVAGNILLRINPYTTKRSFMIENAIYPHVHSYVAPPDIKGVKSIVDLRPVNLSQDREESRLRDGRVFDINKERNSISIEQINGIKTLKINKTLQQKISINQCSNLTTPATVSVLNDAQNLRLNELQKVGHTASIAFDLNGSTGVGTVRFAYNTPITLETIQGNGDLFAWLLMPQIQHLTSVTIRYGTDSSNHWRRTVQRPHDVLNWKKNVFNLLRFSTRRAEQIGLPDKTAIAFIEIDINYQVGSEIERVTIDEITASKGDQWELIYYSNCLFQSSDGEYLTQPTADEDYLLMDNEIINIFLYEAQKVFSQETKGRNMGSDYQTAELMLEGNAKKRGLYELYLDQYPDDSLIETDEYGNDDFSVLA